jgi:hypothetical protein
MAIAAGCWTGTPAPTPLRNAAPRTRTVDVRMAGSDEFDDTPTLSNPHINCGETGEPAPELVAAAERFARARLVSAIRGFSNDEPVVVRSEGDPPDTGRQARIEIVLDVRTVIGSITVWNDSPAIGHIFDTYCTHVTCTATSCAIVVESLPYEGVAG